MNNGFYVSWLTFARDPLSLIGLLIAAGLCLVAIFAPFLAPFPEHAGPIVNFVDAGLAPNSTYLLGTDLVGRDILSRVMFGYRASLAVSLLVLCTALPCGSLLGLIAGYVGGWVEYVVLRAVDIFLAFPPLVLALAIMGFLDPNIQNATIAIAAMWWPRFTRLCYNLSRSEAREGYVLAAHLIGASGARIVVSEILPNCIPALLTQAALDFGAIILTISSLSFLGLGVQAPTPDLGSMVAEGAKYLPEHWWLTMFPALGILLAVLGFNLLGDGIRDVLDIE